MWHNSSAILIFAATSAKAWSNRAEQVRGTINQVHHMMPKSNWVTQVETKEEELWRGVFSFSRRGKKGDLGQASNPPNIKKGVDVGWAAMVGCVSFISPSSNSISPRHPQLHPFREPGGVWEERVYVYGKRWGCLLLKASRVEPLALSPLHPTLAASPLPPRPFSGDKECPECPASPAVSNN